VPKVKIDERRLVFAAIALALAGVVAAVVFPIAVYLFGLSVAPTRPAPAPAAAPQMLRDALWAAADGGLAANLRPINHITLVRLFACLGQAPGTNDNERMRECRHEMPGFGAVNYMAKLHIEERGVVRNSFRGGYSHLATTVWMTRSWSREDLLNTMAERGPFALGWRGVRTAAAGYFGKEPAALTLSEAAYIAARFGDVGDDPWCHPKAAVLARNQILERMRENGAISDAGFQQASTAVLEFATPPEGRPPCSK
jgi:hypothetical protein